MSPVTQQLIDHAQTLSNKASLLFLVEMQIKIKRHSVMVFNTDTQTFHNDEVAAELETYIRTLPIPEGYYQFTVEQILQQFPPPLHPFVIDKLVKVSKEFEDFEVAKAESQSCLSEPQVAEFHRQMLVWIALHERSTTSVN